MPGKPKQAPPSNMENPVAEVVVQSIIEALKQTSGGIFEADSGQQWAWLKTLHNLSTDWGEWRVSIALRETCNALQHARGEPITFFDPATAPTN